MGIKDDFNQAKKLARQGDYIEACQLLLQYDHPKTNELLERIEKAIAGDAQKSNSMHAGTEVAEFRGAWEQTLQANELARQGDYIGARQLLLQYDHPRTNKLLERIEKKIARDAQNSNSMHAGTEVAESQGTWARTLLLLSPVAVCVGLIGTIFGFIGSLCAGCNTILPVFSLYFGILLIIGGLLGLIISSFWLLVQLFTKIIS